MHEYVHDEPYRSHAKEVRVRSGGLGVGRGKGGGKESYVIIYMHKVRWSGGNGEWGMGNGERKEE